MSNANPILKLLCAVGVGFGAGLFVGRARDAPAPAPAASNPRPSTTHDRTRPVTDGAACEARLSACSSAYDALAAESTEADEEPPELTRPRASLSSIGGEPSALETTEAWKGAVTEALQQCDPSIELSTTDCRDWPCIGLTRTIGIDDATKDCFASAIEQSGLSAAGLLEFDVKCRSGGFDTVTVIMAVDESGDAGQAFEETENLSEVLKSYMTLGGRIDTTLRSWDCAKSGL